MKYASLLGAALTWATLGWSSAHADAPSFDELLETSLPDMGAETIPAREAAQQTFQKACFALGTPGRAQARTDACQLIATKLGPDTAKPARLWLLRQLQFIGRAECVDAVARLLDSQDPEIRDAARRALQNNPAPAASAELLAHLADTKSLSQNQVGGLQRPGKSEQPSGFGTCSKSSSWRVALVQALGYRRDPLTVDAVGRLLTDDDATLASAAANTLGKIGTREAAEALAEAVGDAEPQLKQRIADAFLLCLEDAARGDGADEARALFERLYQRVSRGSAIRLACARGMLVVNPDRAVALVLDMLTGDDPQVREVAAGHIANILKPDSVKAFVTAWADLPGPGQRLLLESLAAHGDKGAMPVALQAVRSDDPKLRLAGLRALAILGDASTVPVLVETMAGGGTAEGVAQQTLQQVYGSAVDQAIIDAMQKTADSRLAGVLIDVLDARGAGVAVEALLVEAGGSRAETRRRAVRTLAKLAEPDNLTVMLDLLLKTKPGRDREDTEKAIVQVCGRVAEQKGRADAVLDALADAGPADRYILLPLLGRIGGARALATVQIAVASDRAEIRDAGLRALCNWPDAQVADDLLRMARASDSRSAHIRGLRAYVRVITLKSDRPSEKTLSMLREAMKLATRDEEKQLILRRAASARHIETLRWALPYLDQETLATDASRTVVELAHHRELMGPNQAEFIAALTKVTKVCKDPELVDRARRYMTGL